MISPVYSKLAAWRKWIFIGAAGWTVVLAMVAHSTAKFRNYHQRFAHQFGLEFEAGNERLSNLQRDNHRLRRELKKLPELSAAAAQLQDEITPPATKNGAVWNVQSNALQMAIQETSAELTELYRWHSEKSKAEQVGAAQARLAERALEFSGDPDQQYAEVKQTLATLALSRKRLIDIRKEWMQLPQAEKDRFRPRLEEAQAQWSAANEKLGRDEVLYKELPRTNSAQDPSTILFMRSIIPDLNGMSVSVYLDGTVNITKTTDTP